MKILIVDDSALIQDRLYALIREEKGFEIIGQAFNAIDGKSMINKHQPDVVISDIRMPGGGGMELLTFIKSKFPKIKVIIITNYAYTQYKDKAHELGAEHFLSKSENLEDIIPVLKEISQS